MDNLFIIKDRLNEAMILREMTGADLAHLTGLNRSSVSRYLSGKAIPRTKAIGAMAQALHVSPAWVLGYDVPMEDSSSSQLEIYKLNKENQARLLAYYQALIDSQEGNNGNS